MGVFDPIECKAARDYLKQNLPIEAARVLLGSKNRHHRSVRELLVDVGRQLIDLAERQVDGEYWEAAWGTLQLAGQCVALNERGLALLRRVARVRAERKWHDEELARRRAKVAEKLAQVEALVKEGDFRSALQILEQLRAGGESEAAEKIIEVEQLRERFRRLVEECRNAILVPDPGLARQLWERAKSLCPASPEAKRLAAELARIAVVGAADSSQPLPVRDRSQRFVLDEVAVILTEQIALGSPRGENVQLPLLGRIHGRHAVLVRDRHGWQIMACRDKYGQPCPLAIDGQPVNGVARLRDGNVVELDSSCRWRFRLPVGGSFTAIWEALPDFQGSILCPGGRTCKQAVLLAEECVLAPAAPAHLTCCNLPGQRIVLRWQNGALHWSVEGASAWMEIPGLTWHHTDSQVYLPSRLTVERELSEVELLGRVFLDAEANERLTLTFLPWAA